MARSDLSEVVTRLGQHAEAVCRRYLPAGRRRGNYWQVGNARNTPGSSMFVRLKDSPKGPAGNWQDAATGEFGDLLDIIRESRGLREFRDALDEARFFLRMARSEPIEMTNRTTRSASTESTSEAARRLFAMSQTIGGTLAETYLRGRGITALHDTASLRFHPRCYYKPDDESPTELWPAMIASVTDTDHRLTGVLRTWLDPHGFSDATLGKAPIETPRRAIGDLAGRAVRFGAAGEVMAVSEGIETALSLRSALPTLPVAAALSASNLAVFDFPDTLRRLYVVRDNDPAGERAAMTLIDRAREAGVDAFVIEPTCADFNEDLQLLGPDDLRRTLPGQLTPNDVTRFFECEA